MIEKYLRDKYENSLVGLDIYENNNSLRLARIVIKPEFRNEGVGTKLMTDLIIYADQTKKIIVLTPASDFGGNKNKLIQFYKRFGFKLNQGNHKNYEFSDTMIRYPNLNENMKPMIKKLLREAVMTKEDTDVREITDFINFAKQYLGIDDDIKILLAFEKTPDIRTTAYYHNGKFIKVYVKDRAIVDICRSISHELTHHKQFIEGRITDPEKDGADGSDIENEANATAGVIIRKYGRLKPEIYK